jgi:hypothetical protein
LLRLKRFGAQTIGRAGDDECDGGHVAFYRDISISRRVSKRYEPKPCIFIGSSLKDLKRFPATMQNRVGYALNQVQEGDAELHFRARAESGEQKP